MMFVPAVGTDTFLISDHSWVYNITYGKPWMKTITIFKSARHVDFIRSYSLCIKTWLLTKNRD